MPFPVDPLWRTYDTTDDAVTTILAEHALIHKGLLFSAVHKFDNVASGATVYLALTTPANIEVHLKVALIVTDSEKILVTVTEDATYSGGTQVSPFNRNRNSANASLTNIFSGVTGVSGGTNIDVDYLGGGASPGPKATAIGTEVAGTTEWVLKPSTNYVISIRNDGASTASIIVKLIWYEVRR